MIVAEDVVRPGFPSDSPTTVAENGACFVFSSRAQETRLDPAPFAPSRHARHRGKYGRAQLTRELREASFPVNHKRVRRLMLRKGQQARRRRRFVCTTDSGHSLPVAPNLLERDFSARTE